MFLAFIRQNIQKDSSNNMASNNLLIIVVVIIAAVGGFYLYRRFKRDMEQKKLQNFANPIPDVTSTLGVEGNFLSPITKKAVLG